MGLLARTDNGAFTWLTVNPQGPFQAQAGGFIYCGYEGDILQEMIADQVVTLHCCYTLMRANEGCRHFPSIGTSTKIVLIN